MHGHRRRALAAAALCLLLAINTAASRLDEAESEAETNRWFFSSWFSSGQAAVQTDDRALNAVLKIFGLEAGCRNNTDDTMNQFEGRTGYTCYGINPQSGWNSKDLYPNCNSCQRDKVLFTQCCHNLDPEAFKRNSAKVFVRNYFSPGGCNDLPPSAYFVCGHIALWSGTGRSTQWVKELGPCGRGCNEKEYCNKLNEKHREFLQKVASTEKTEIQKEKHRAWFQKIDDRKRECDNVGGDGSQQQQQHQGPEKKHSPPTQEQLDAAGNIANAVTETANKAAERLEKDEGPCQNHKDDPVNSFAISSESSVGSQSAGFTCLGLSAQNAWDRRQLFPECIDCSSNPSNFGKCCHDKNPTAFAKSAKSAMVSGLFTPAGCLDLPWPALYACAHVAATGSVSIAAAIRKELGPCFPGNGCNVKEFCHKFNNKYKAQWQTAVKGGSKSGAYTEAHQKRHEARSRACDEAPAPTPSASAQSEALKPSDPIPVTVVAGGGSSIPDLGNEPVMKALRSILAHEMDCHNIATDRGNKMANKLGFTCLGLAPSVGWHWRSYFPECDQACNKDPVMFVKCCRDHDPIKFFINAARVYKENYWTQSGCSNLAFPAAHVCLDIAINTGTGRAKHYIHEMGPCPANGAPMPTKSQVKSLQPSGPCDAVKYCMELNEKHKELYVRIPQVDGVQQPFLQGWLDRYEDRKKVCNGQDPVNTQVETAVQQALAPLTEHTEHSDPVGAKCAALGGKCQPTTTPCGGKFVDASHAPCPGSSRCCVAPSQSQQTNLPPPPPTAPQQTQNSLSLSADDGAQAVDNTQAQQVNQQHQQHQQHQQQHQQQQQQQSPAPVSSRGSGSSSGSSKSGYQGPTAPVTDGADPGKGLCGEYEKIAKQAVVVTGVQGKKFAVVKALPVHLQEPSIRSKKVEEEDNSMEVHTACAFSKMAYEASSDRFKVQLKIKKGFRVAARGEEVHGNGLALDFNIDCGPQNESLPSRCRADKVYSWLRERGPIHGFCRTIKAEPFHWEFRGKGCAHRTDDGQPIQA